MESNDKHFTTDWAPLYLQTGIEGEGYDRRIKLYLTRESLPPWKSKADNYLSCSFETRTYVRDKSSSNKEADYFREQMDRVVTSIQTQFNKIKSSS